MKMVLADPVSGRSLDAALWDQRFRELTAAYRAAHQTVVEATEILADAIAELKEKAEAPGKQAPLYGRESRPLPFSPELLRQQIDSALQRRGITTKKGRA